MKINYAAIQKKVESDPAVRRKIEEKKKRILSGNGEVRQKVSEVADDFSVRLHRSIEELGSTSGFEDGKLGATAVEALLEAMKQDILDMGNGRYRIHTYFSELHRESLAPDKYPRGVDDLVVLLNSGYDTGHTVRGVWRGHGDDERYSLTHRQGAHFIETSMRDFEQNFEREHKGVRLFNISQEDKI